jgi:hypothetical protein
MFASRITLDQLRLSRLVAIAVVTLTALVAGVGNAGAATACPEGQLLLPYDATVGGSETQGYCISVSNGPTGGTRVDGRYSTVATQSVRRFVQLKGGTARQVFAVCWSQKDWNALDRKHEAAYGDEGVDDLAGFVMPGWNALNLSPETCRELDRITYRGGRATPKRSAFHIDTLVHEALHVAGSLNEAKTACYAMQLAADAAVDLGQSRSFGRSAARQLQRDYASYGAQHPKYWTPNCHNGTSLDLRPGTLQFP